MEGGLNLIQAMRFYALYFSNAEGIENPVFDDAPAANLGSKPRPQLTYMASRQLSESGRHLLSEPNTPLSPPSAGECFFPSLGKYLTEVCVTTVS